MKTKPRKSLKRNTGMKHKTKFSKKGVSRIMQAMAIKDYEIDDNVKLTCMDNIRNRAKLSMRGQRLSLDEVKKILEIVRNEK